MPDINPSLPVVGQPDSTEEPKVVTALTQLIAAVNDVDSAQIQDGTITIADLLLGEVLKTGAVVTALPSSPVDGQECFYLADDTNGIVWRLKYRAGSASNYKWEYVGGHALRAATTVQIFATSAEMAGYTNRGGESITVPLAGDYHTAFGAQIGVSGGALGQSGYIGSAVGDTNPTNTAVHGEEQHTFVGGTSWGAVSMTSKHTGVAADAAIKLRYTAGGSLAGNGSVSWLHRWLEVVPIRVG